MQSNRVFCPHCHEGFYYNLKSLKRAQLLTHSVNGNVHFEFALPDNATIESIPQLFEYGFFQQALLTAGVGGGLGLALGAPIAHMAGDNALTILVTSGAIGIASGLLWLHDYSKTRLRTVKFLMSRLCTDWQQGKEDARRTIEVVVPANNGQTILRERWPELPVTFEKFDEWCESAIRGQSLAYVYWTGSGKLFNKSGEYIPLLNYLKMRRVVADKGGNIGHVLTPTGERIIKAYLSPLPGSVRL